MSLLRSLVVKSISEALSRRETVLERRVLMMSIERTVATVASCASPSNWAAFTGVS